MDPERWHQASRILASVLERKPERRAAYLDEVCANDVELRREVESLLAASEKAESLLDSPAMEMAAPLFVESRFGTGLERTSWKRMTLSVGTRLGPFEILGSIGAGGMGEVWRAIDTRLDRE